LRWTALPGTAERLREAAPEPEGADAPPRVARDAVAALSRGPVSDEHPARHEGTPDEGRALLPRLASPSLRHVRRLARALGRGASRRQGRRAPRRRAPTRRGSGRAPAGVFDLPPLLARPPVSALVRHRRACQAAKPRTPCGLTRPEGPRSSHVRGSGYASTPVRGRKETSIGRPILDCMDAMHPRVAERAV